MPTYDYECQACHHRFERMQGMSAPHVRTCPKCGKKRVERHISGGSGLLFKGSGFYITDYRSKGYQDKAKADSEAAKPKEEKPKEAKPKTDGKKADKPVPAKEPKKPS